MNKLRYLFLLIMMGLSVNCFAQTKTPVDSLHNASVMRPNDLIKQIPQWNISSTDLFTYRLDSGLYGFYGPQPEIMIDGIPVDIDYFGFQNLNMLPLFIDNIDTSTSRFTPQIYNHTLADAGLVDFKMASPDAGLHIRSSFYLGNESGDPGPYIFDSLKTTPNIDRYGPDGSILLTYKKSSWYAKGLFSFRNHQPTDLIQNQRIHITASVLGTNLGFKNYKLQTTTKSGLFETGYLTEKWKFRIRGIYGEDKDYLFLQPLGREIPTQTTYQQLAIDGTYQAGNWLLKGRYISHNKKIGKRYALHTYIFDWNQTSNTLSASAKYNTHSFSIEPGIIYERLNTKAPGINQPFNDLTTVFLKSGFSINQKATFNINAHIDYDEETFAKNLRLSLPVNITGSWNIQPAFFYTELLPLRQESFAYWVSRGYTFANELDITIDQPLESFQNKLTGFKLTNDFSLSKNVNLSLEQQLIHHQALNVPWQVVKENEFLDTLPGIFTATSERGERFSLRAEFKHTISSLLRQKLGFHGQYTLSGTDRYKNYFKQIPQTKISYQLDVLPTPDLTLSFQATYRASTTWSEFQALEGVKYMLPSGIPIRPVSGTFHTQTPAFTNVTLGIRKWFWDRHLSTQFSVQNLLNQEIRTHTLGAELSTKFNAKLEVHF